LLPTPFPFSNINPLLDPADDGDIGKFSRSRLNRPPTVCITKFRKTTMTDTENITAMMIAKTTRIIGVTLSFSRNEIMSAVHTNLVMARYVKNTSPPFVLEGFKAR
jgi:hypothetical protein